jgi:hypothetical protein
MSWNIQKPGDFINGPLTVTGTTTITGDLTVATNILKVDTTNNRVGFGTATPLNRGQIQGAGQATVTPTVTGDQSALSLIDSGTSPNNGGMLVLGSTSANGNFGQVAIKALLTNASQNGTSDLAIFTRAAFGDTTLSERFRINQAGICTWSNISGVAGTAMTLNSTGLLVGTTSASGSSSNATALVFGGAKTASGSVSATTAVATTIFSITAALTGRYEVVALVGFSGAPAQYTAIATIIWDGNGSRVVANNGANLTITISGTNVQITQTSGSTQTVSWSFLRIAL